jgi:hypothetical protein
MGSSSQRRAPVGGPCRQQGERTTHHSHVATTRVTVYLAQDYIAQVVNLARDKPQLKLVIIGSAEAHLVASSLARHNVAVILSPWRCQPLMFEQRFCHTGPPLYDDTGVQILLEAGVRVAIASSGDNSARILFRRLKGRTNGPPT